MEETPRQTTAQPDEDCTGCLPPGQEVAVHTRQWSLLARECAAKESSIMEFPCPQYFLVVAYWAPSADSFTLIGRLSWREKQ